MVVFRWIVWIVSPLDGFGDILLFTGRWKNGGSFWKIATLDNSVLSFFN